MNFNLFFEDLPKTAKAVGRTRVNPVSKSTNEATKPSKKYAKSRAEHYKDIAIFVLVTGIIAFVAGVQVANSNNAQIQEAVKALAPSASAETTDAEASK